MEASVAAEQRGGGKLRQAGPLGKIKGRLGMRRCVWIVNVLMAKLSLDDGAHCGAFGRGCSLPIDLETLAADTALDVVGHLRLAK
jgi:hypothetical protein